MRKTKIICTLGPASTNEEMLEKMLKAAEAMHGRRDYSAFCAAGATVKDFVRNLEYVRLSKSENLITLKTSADGYLYNMVRILAGTLCEAGAGRLDPETVPAILASRDRSKAGPTLPAQGLFLKCVNYN